MRTIWGMAVKACDHPRSRLLNGVFSVGPCPTAWPTGWTALQATLLDINAVPATAVKNSVAASALQCNGTVMLLRHTLSAELAWILGLAAPSSAIPDRFSVLLTNTVRGCHAIAHSSASTVLKAGRRTVEEGRRTYGCNTLKRPLKQLCHCHECAYSCACRLAYSFARADGTAYAWLCAWSAARQRRRRG
jgi:hypothetical protein